jgi:hypothetical protein
MSTGLKMIELGGPGRTHPGRDTPKVIEFNPILDDDIFFKDQVPFSSELPAKMMPTLPAKPPS